MCSSSYSWRIPQNLDRKLKLKLVVHYPELPFRFSEEQRTLVFQIERDSIEQYSVSRLDPRSPLERAGLKVNDIFVNYNGLPIDSMDDYIAANQDDRSDGADMVVLRDNKKVVVSLEKVGHFSGIAIRCDYR